MHNICETRQLKAQSGHIITPDYPLPYYRHLHCNVTIVVDRSQKLRLNLVTMELTPRGKTDCADWLYFNDKFHSLTVCGHRYNVWYEMNSNFLHIELESTSSTRSQGFWLYYEGMWMGYPCLDLSCLGNQCLDLSCLGNQFLGLNCLGKQLLGLNC